MADSEAALGLEVRLVTAADRAALEGLFDAVGSSCFCRYFHFEGDKNDWLAALAFAPDDQRNWLASGLASGSAETRGLIARTNDGQVVGWLKLAQKSCAPKLYGQRYYRSLACLAEGDAERTAHLSCSLIHPSFRNRGLLAELVRGAVLHAAELGFTQLEAFPRVVACRVTDEEMFTLPASVLTAQGFEVVGGDPAYPVVRLPLVKA